MPFVGSQVDLERLRADLRRLTLRAPDELIVADNRGLGARGAWAHDGTAPVRICRADAIRSPGFARNTAARIATGKWLLFIDADTRPAPGLLDAYFDPPPRPQTAVLAGSIADLAPGRSWVARHAAGRAQMSQRTTLDRRGTPYAQTANCAVLRSAFESVGGFAQDIKAGEDADLCFRLARSGWTIEERAHARVEHLSRDTLGSLLTQLARHGSGAAWLERRYPGEFPAPAPRELAARVLHRARAGAGALTRGDQDAALGALLGLLGETAFDFGRLLSNSAV